jgi:hypothetical protein
MDPLVPLLYLVHVLNIRILVQRNVALISLTLFVRPIGQLSIDDSRRIVLFQVRIEPSTSRDDIWMFVIGGQVISGKDSQCVLAGARSKMYIDCYLLFNMTVWNCYTDTQNVSSGLSFLTLQLLHGMLSRTPL